MLIVVFVVKLALATFTILTCGGVSHRKAIRTALSITPIGEFSLIFMIKAKAMGLVSRRLYLLFLAITVVFLGFSPVLNQYMHVATTRRQEQGRKPSMEKGEFAAHV